MKKYFNRFINSLLTLVALGCLYFIGHVMNQFGVFTYVWANAIPMFAAYITGVASMCIVLFFIPGERADETMYEAAIADLQKQLTDEQNNYNLMRSANESLSKEKSILYNDVQRQAEIISKLATKISQIQLQLESANDKIKTSNISNIKIDEKGKIV